MTHHHRFRLAVFTSLVPVFMSTAAASARPQVTNTSFPLGAFAEVPCALGGEGEEVLVEGTAHVVVIEREDGTTVHANYSAMKGVGLTSGIEYVAVSAENEHFEVATGDGAVVSMHERTVRFIGRGPGGDVSFRASFHVTVTPDGDVVVDRSVIISECR